MEITGRIIAVLPVQGGISKNGNEWKKQEYVLETHDQYPKKVCFQIFGADRIDQAAIQPGEELTVFFDIDGTLIDMEKKCVTEKMLETLRRLQEKGIGVIKFLNTMA